MISKELLRAIRNELPMSVTILRLGRQGPVSKQFEGYLRFICLGCGEFRATVNPRNNLACCRLHSDRSLGVILTEQSSKFDCLITPAIRQSPAPRLLYPAPRLFVKTSYPAQPRPFFCDRLRGLFGLMDTLR